MIVKLKNSVGTVTADSEEGPVDVQFTANNCFYVLRISTGGIQVAIKDQRQIFLHQFTFEEFRLMIELVQAEEDLL